MNAFLSSTKVLFEKSLQKTFEVVHIILGNPSCDLDSCVSAVVLAWIKAKNNGLSSSALYIPVMNIKRSEFRLRTETTFLFKKLNIETNNLYFRDELDLQDLAKIKQKNFLLTLVDHHVLAKCDEELMQHVKKIYDHRIVTREIQPHIETNIALVGSCSTLVAEEGLSSLGKNAIIEDVKTLLLGAILLDTANLSVQAGKVTSRDREVVNKLSGNIIHESLVELFYSLCSAKASIEGLSTKDMLLKDPKILEGSSHTIVFSSLHQSLEEFLQRSDVHTVIPAYCLEENLLAWICLAPSAKALRTECFKSIAVYSTNKEVQEKIINQLVSNKDFRIQRSTEKSPFNGLKCLRMYNTQKTRKQVLPLVDDVLLSQF